MIEERVNRAIIAAILVPRAMDGRMKLFHESAPVVGSHFKLTEKTIMRRKPIQKDGMEIPDMAIVMPV